MEIEQDSLAFQHAWNWFEFHAKQRMTMIRFYLIVAGGIAAGVGYLWVAHEYLLTIILCAFGALASYCFRRLDRRVGDLVKIGEQALHCQQHALSSVYALPSLRICEAADDVSGSREKHYPYTYGQNFRLLFWACILVFLTVLALSTDRLLFDP